MTVYVDGERNRFRRMVMCHMIADTLVELDWMADRIGLRREWFQPFSFPHYDLSQSRRVLAVREGAVEISRQQLAKHMKRLRNDPEFMESWKQRYESHQRQQAVR